MFDQCLKILLIFGSFSAVARGEDLYTSTSTSTNADNYNGKLSYPYVLFEPAAHECYADDPNCDWENDPSADLSWDLDPSSFGVIQRNSYMFDGLIYRHETSPRGNSSIRMISPIFRRDSNYSCVTFGVRMNTYSKSGLVGLRVYQKPVHIALTDLIAYSDGAKKDYIIFGVWGDQGNYWHTQEFPLKHFDSNFQIILEGIFGKDRMNIRIGYIALKQITECKGESTSTTISTTTTMSTTTTERPMGENGDTITDEVMTSDTWVDSPSPYTTPWVEGSARGEDEYTSTSTSTNADDYNGCYAGDPNCEWKNDPSASLSWGPSPWRDGPKHPTSYFRGSSPRGNSYVRSISPIFRRDDNYGCVTFEYRTRVLARSGFVGLRVYQKPVHIALTDLIAYSEEAKKDYILFDILEHQGYYGHTKEFPLKHFDSNFQIIIEGIVGQDIAHIEIIHIALKQRTECTGTTTTTTMSTTTTERAMGENGDTITDKVKA